MVNRQTFLLLLVGAAIAAGGVVAALLSPLTDPQTGFPNEIGAGSWTLLVVAALVVGGSQLLVIRSTLRTSRTPGGGDPSVRSNPGQELLWSVVPSAMVLAAIGFALARA